MVMELRPFDDSVEAQAAARAHERIVEEASQPDASGTGIGEDMDNVTKGVVELVRMIHDERSRADLAEHFARDWEETAEDWRRLARIWRGLAWAGLLTTLAAVGVAAWVWRMMR